eukprot:jgi/Chrzof1/3504/Cz12g27250.t1
MPSDYPIECRVYPTGSAMPWHKDEALYQHPQWELILTVANSSDSRTIWRDDEGCEQDVWTQPNSILAVQVRGCVQH